MPKTLRLGFAMGGGVSMGAFSGGGLLESVKLLLLYGQDRKGNRYDDIVIDVMSGSSAGAISLLIMVRALVDYPAMQQLLGITEQALSQEILQQYGRDYGDLSPRNKKAFRAAHVAQLLQRKLWVKEVTLDKLFGDTILPDYLDPGTDGFGLLSRKLFNRLVKDYILKNAEAINTNGLALLGDRVLFAFSLTNLKPIPTGSNKKKEPTYEIAIHEAQTSKIHKELRIVDFHLGPDNLESEINFLEVRDTSNEQGIQDNASEKNKQFSIGTKNTWRILADTAIACGAFPIAFQPMPLERYKYEYSVGDVKWPSAIEKRPSYTFSYIDGGTLNNEPIREAFRLANYLDHREKAGNGDFDRLILFIDPLVSDPLPDFRINSYTRYFHDKKGRLKTRSEFIRMADYAGEVLSVLRNEGSVVEEDKINSFLQNKDMMQEITTYLRDTEFTISDSQKHLPLLKSILDRLEKEFKNQLIPLFGRDPAKLIYTKAKAMAAEDDKVDISDPAYRIDPKAIKDDLASIKAKKVPYTSKSMAFWIRVYFQIMAEQLLDYGGKDQSASRLAIAPLDFTDKGPAIISLPGAELQAFAGFASSAAREAAFQFARYASLKVLNSSAFRQKEEKPYLKQAESETKIATFLNQYNNEYLEEQRKKVKREVRQRLEHPLMERLETLAIRPLKRWKKAAIWLFRGRKRIRKKLGSIQSDAFARSIGDAMPINVSANNGSIKQIQVIGPGSPIRIEQTKMQANGSITFLLYYHRKLQIWTQDRIVDDGVEYKEIKLTHIRLTDTAKDLRNIPLPDATQMKWFGTVSDPVMVVSEGGISVFDNKKP
jgi:predicted acylesterase/phospholipase RssA